MPEQSHRTISIPQALALGMEHQRAGRLAEAESIYRRVLQFDPRNADAFHLLGLLAHGSARPDVAAELIGRAIAIDAHVARYHSDQAVVLAQLGRHEQAVAACQFAIKIDPDYVGARNNLGLILRALGRTDEAIGWFDTALRRDPNHCDTLNNLAIACKDQGRIDEAIKAIRRAITACPAAFRMHSNLLLMLHYLPDCDPTEVFQKHLVWARRHAQPIMDHPATAHDNDRDPDRRLRIGLVSPDLMAHPIAYFIEPVLSARDPNLIETFCYSDTMQGDLITTRLRMLADHWRPIAGMSDAQVAERVRQDQIDILVDLSGHTGDHRLLVFARRPAPVQVSYLGYPDTTGIAAIDYVLTDDVVDPDDGSQSPRFVEKLNRLPGGFACFAPLDDTLVSPASALDESAPPVFGAMPVLAKLNETVIDTWAAILRAVPASKLLLYRHNLRDATRQRLLGQFTSRGIQANRLDFRNDLNWREPPPAELVGRWHLPLYREIDICLDTFPWSGHTSACEALWMGVPVVTLRGQTHAGRMVASTLSQAALAQLIAETPPQYVGKAVELSGRVRQLRSDRALLRARIRESRLCNSAGFARDLENAFRQMWQTWCSK